MSSEINSLSNLKKYGLLLGTVLFDILLVYGIGHYAYGGWHKTIEAVYNPRSHFWIAYIFIAILTLIKSDVRDDLPLFIAAIILGFWGEWWGTSQGVWSYYGKQTPPIYIIFFWGIGLLTVYHLHLLTSRLSRKLLPKEKIPGTPILLLAMALLLLAGFVLTWKGIVRVDWLKYLDIHFILAGIVTAFLLIHNFDAHETFSIFLSGTLLGGIYEYAGTAIGGWTYITGQGIPLVIAPLWGIACVAMIKLGFLIKHGVIKLIGVLIPQISSKPSSI